MKVDYPYDPQTIFKIDNGGYPIHLIHDKEGNVYWDHNADHDIVPKMLKEIETLKSQIKSYESIFLE